MTSHLEITTEGRLGVIALNRPEAINALSLEMIEAITAQLGAWQTDDRVRAVLFEGRGPKGFCAGGDVRVVRELVLEGNLAAADAYFAAEYRMNGLIATYPKPVVSVADGVVMGGGIGIAGHAAFRVTTPTARYAMPEGAIGFVPDVGVNFLLGKAPQHRALLFLMTGLPVGGADVLALGLADCCVAPERLAELRARIVNAAGTGDIEPALVALLQSESIQAGERVLSEAAVRLLPALGGADAAAIVAGVVAAAVADPGLAPYAEALQARSPTSLAAIVMGHRAARVLSSVHEVLDLELRLASYMARQPDFAEGVRAQLVDKDRQPRWTPARLEEVSIEALQAVLAGAPQTGLTRAKG